MDKPKVLHTVEVGKEKQYRAYMCLVPGNNFVLVQVHRDYFDAVRVDPKTMEITLPPEAAFNLQPLPEGTIGMAFKGIISLWPKKA